MNQPRFQTARYLGSGLLLALAIALPILPLRGQTTWTTRTAPQMSWLKGVAYGGGVFIAVGDEGMIFRSADRGATWEQRGSAEVKGFWYKGIGYGDGKFIAVGDNDAAISTDLGMTWAALPSLPEPAAGIAYANGLWVAVGGTILTSSNSGASWTQRGPAGTALDLASVTFNGSIGVAVGGSVHLSTDGGTRWTDVAGGSLNWLTDVAYGNGLYVAVGGLFGNILAKTTNPQNWPPESAYEFFDVTGLQGVAFGNGKFVVVAGKGVIVSSNGTGFWLDEISGAVEDLHAVAFGDGMFVAVGDRGVILTAGTAGQAPEITSPLTASAKVGQPFSYTITANHSPTSFGADNLPATLQIDTQTGKITGTPAAAETRQVTIRARNAQGEDARTLVLTVAPATPSNLTVKIHTAVELEFPTAVGKTYQVQITRNLIDWENYGSSLAGTGQTLYVLYTTREANVRAYRVLEQ